MSPSPILELEVGGFAFTVPAAPLARTPRGRLLISLKEDSTITSAGASGEYEVTAAVPCNPPVRYRSRTPCPWVVGRSLIIDIKQAGELRTSYVDAKASILCFFPNNTSTAGKWRSWSRQGLPPTEFFYQRAPDATSAGGDVSLLILHANMVTVQSGTAL
jgi:hypothetical protein